MRQPWFYPPYQFHVGTDVGVSFFSDVNNGINPIGYHSINEDWALFAIFPFSETFDAQLEVNFNHTSKKDFNFETFVAQVRKQILDDVTGDFVSLYWGFNYRYVLKGRLSDVATPYHNISNFEITGCLGKEFTKEFKWYLRTFLWGGIGQANTGYPWARFDFNVKGKAHQNFLIGAGSEGYFGLGPTTIINVNNFGSYAHIKHQSVDLYAQFGYFSPIWGTLMFKYAMRPYARTYPDNYNAFLLTYDYPFSF